MFGYPAKIRRAIYTTNTIESLNMSGKQSHRCVTSFASIVTLTLVLCASALGQSTPEKRPARKTEKPPAADTARWRYMLEDLAKEARTALNVEKRPQLLAEVADAY
jgi:hypothetical protein